MLEQAKKQVAAIQANAHKFKQPSKPIEDNTNPRALSVIDDLFTRLKAISSVGNAFKSESEEAIVKQEWMLAFKEEGITKQAMIDEGLEAFRAKARKSESTTWFPSIAEFIRMCKGGEDKTKQAERAYKLFIRREKQTDNIGIMVTGNHSFDLRNLKSDKCKREFVKLYLEYADNHAIKPLPWVSLPKEVRLSPEQQKDARERATEAMSECLGKIKSELNMEL